MTFKLKNPKLDPFLNFKHSPGLKKKLGITCSMSPKLDGRCQEPQIPSCHTNDKLDGIYRNASKHHWFSLVVPHQRVVSCPQTPKKGYDL